MTPRRGRLAAGLRLAAIAAPLLAGCATGDLARSDVDRVYHSAQPRAAIADCLLNRLSGIDGRLARSAGPDATTVSLTSGAAHVAVYLFTIRDAPAADGAGHRERTGSVTELRRLHSLSSPGLTNAETCF